MREISRYQSEKNGYLMGYFVEKFNFSFLSCSLCWEIFTLWKKGKVHTKLYSMRFSLVEIGKILSKSISIIARFQIMTKSSVYWIVIDFLIWLRLFGEKTWIEFNGRQSEMPKCMWSYKAHRQVEPRNLMKEVPNNRKNVIILGSSLRLFWEYINTVGSSKPMGKAASFDKYLATRMIIWHYRVICSEGTDNFRMK
jgi:hypothetical protein